MLHTTFTKAHEAGACIESYRKFAKFKGGVNTWGKDKPFSLSEVLEVCGLDDALWALRIVLEPADREIRLFACDCAERVLPIFESKYPEDKRPRQAIEVARKFANGLATIEELAVAGDAAWGAAAWAVAGAAAWDAAWAAAWDAAWAAAWAAARDAARAVAGAAARDAARAAAKDAEREWQTQRFIQLLNQGS